MTQSPSNCIMTNDLTSSQGLHGRNFDAFVSSQQSYNDDDVTSKLQEKYWQAKQKFLETIKKKEDECIVLSDAKLDAKLEVFRSIDKSCEKLIDALDIYQNCLYVLANEENSLGKFLRDCSKQDKTKAGKVLSTSGKAFTFASHQRIQLYGPLLRLYQEIETFHVRAVDDTMTTVDKLEKSRTQYRSSLLWMKDISQKLDPDTYRQLEKFRKVQNQVRLNKGQFDRIQLDTFQKIDLLMASRCNLINQVLAAYQSSLLQTFEKNMQAFANAEALIQAEDIHDYEFKTLKELNAYKSSTSNDDQTEQGYPSTSQHDGVFDKCSEVKPDMPIESQTRDVRQDLLNLETETDVREEDILNFQQTDDVPGKVSKSDLLESLYSNELSLLGDLDKIDDELSEFLSNLNTSSSAPSQHAMSSKSKPPNGRASNTHGIHNLDKPDQPILKQNTTYDSLIGEAPSADFFLDDLLGGDENHNETMPEGKAEGSSLVESNSNEMLDLFTNNMMLPSKLLSSTSNADDLFSLLDPNDPGYNINKVMNRRNAATELHGASSSGEQASDKKGPDKDWLSKLADLDPLGDFSSLGGTTRNRAKDFGDC